MIAEINPKPEQSIARRLARGFGWGALGTLGWRGMTAASSVAVARLLGPAGFGELAIVRSTATLFTTYAGFRLGLTINKFLPPLKGTNPARAARILRMALTVSALLCGLAAAGLMLGAGPIAEHILHNAGLTWALRIAALWLFFQAYSSVRETVLIAAEDYPAFARVTLVKGLSAGLFILPGAWLGGPTGAIAGLAIAAALSFLVLDRAVRRTLAGLALNQTGGFRAWKSELPLLWTFALPSLLAGAVAASAFWYGRALLTGLDDGFAQLGHFEAANQWRTLILFLPAMLARMAMPILAEAHSRTQSDDFRQASILQIRAIIVITLPLTVATILGAQPLMAIFGSAYAGSAALLPLLMISVFLFALNQGLRKVQEGSGKVWQALAMQGVWAAAFLLVLWRDPGQIGALTLAQAMAGAEAVKALVQAAYVELSLAPGTLMRLAPDLALAAAAIGLAIGGEAVNTPLSQPAAALLALIPAMAILARVLRRHVLTPRAPA